MWDKKKFIPFIEERTHLGKIIDSKASDMILTKKPKVQIYFDTIDKNKVKFKPTKSERQYSRIR